jgi:hypothetical protein
VILGGLLILNGFITIMESYFEQYVDEVLNYLLTAIEKNDDETCVRLSCGLISDIANHLEKRVAPFLPALMQTLNKVLINNNYASETKAKAIIAVGDICLASEEHFAGYLDETMHSLMSAAEITT